MNSQPAAPSSAAMAAHSPAASFVSLAADARQTRIRRAGLERPLHWLRAGWADLAANPLPSLAYGLLFALAGDLLLLAALPSAHLFVFVLSGFFLLGPLLAAGLYELSRRHSLDAGRPPYAQASFFESLAGCRRAGSSLALFGLLLSLITLYWERFCAVIFALLYSGDAGFAGGSLADFLQIIVLSGTARGLLAIWLLSGLLLAGIVFTLSAVAVPLMVDRDSDVFSAVALSVAAVRGNPATMLLWAMLIVGLTLLGFATLLIGLVVIMPLLGHATWHAYRELVE